MNKIKMNYNSCDMIEVLQVDHPFHLDLSYPDNFERGGESDFSEGINTSSEILSFLSFNIPLHKKIV